MMQREGVDPKRIFIAMALIAFFILGFEIFSYYYFSRQASPAEEPAREAVKEKPKTLPKLMIGTRREKAGLGDTVKIDLGDYEIELALRGGRIVKLVDKKFGFDLVSEAERSLKVFPLEVFTGDPEVDQRINFGTYRVTKESDRIVLILEDDEIKLKKILESRGDHFLVDLETNLKGPVYLLAGSHPSERSFYTHEGPVMKIDGKVLRVDPDDIKGRQVFEGRIEFAGEESRYFFKGFKGDIDSVVVEKVSYGDGKEATFTYVETGGQLLMYMGAKYYSRIRDLGLGDLLDYGMLKIIVKPLFVFMYWVYEVTRSWIASIVILTLILRIVFFPLNYKSTTSMMKLQEAAPKLEKIRKKYKDDPAKMQEEMMKLYSEIGFNPMSGCLPILVQIPIFFALYKVLIITVDLKLSGLLWIPSLADKDPFYILPVVMGLTMILQQRITPSPDPKQNLIMYISAVVFTILFANFPSGLVLYWTVNNVLNIGQNYLIKNYLLRGKSPKTT